MWLWDSKEREKQKGREMETEICKNEKRMMGRKTLEKKIMKNYEHFLQEKCRGQKELHQIFGSLNYMDIRGHPQKRF